MHRLIQRIKHNQDLLFLVKSQQVLQGSGFSGREVKGNVEYVGKCGGNAANENVLRCVEKEIWIAFHLITVN